MVVEPKPNDVTSAAIMELIEGKGHKTNSIDSLLS
ncbi:type II toxin-antitoxin system RelB/DinJ family antitoxin [Vibrio breoganii]|nr:type II toxin-antitoxin system RelB/DinJ family antitoxin [Vibrio breoganii]